MRICHVCPYIYPAEQVGVKAGLHVEPLVVCDRKYSLLIGISAAEVISHFVRGIGYGELIVLVDSGLVCFLEPVSLVFEAVRQAHYADFIHKVLVLGGIQDVICLCYIGKSDGSVEADLRSFALFALFGGDEHDSVCGTRAVYGSRGCVLQNLHSLDVLR